MEKNYCVTRRELLAMVKSVRHFHKYLYGQKFVLRTDHAALKWLLQFKEPEGQLARWIEQLQCYDFNIEHRKGTAHGNADALSRRPCQEDCRQCTKAEHRFNVTIQHTKVCADNDIWIKDEQAQDLVLNKIISALQQGVRPKWDEISGECPLVKAYWAQWKSLSLKDGILYRIWESVNGNTKKELLVAARSMVPEILKEYHNNVSGGHCGSRKTLEEIKARYYWIGCREDVENWIRCDVCAKAKGPYRKPRCKMKQYNVGAPFERVGIDVLGPFPTSKRGNKYILMVMDYFSKWPEAYAIPNQEAKTICDMFVQNWVSRFGVPMELHSDQGRNFESNIFRGICIILGINKTRTTPLHPQSDGMVERFNRTLEERLRKVVSQNQKDWDEHVQLFLMAYRSAKHDTTRFTPAKILFGDELRLPADLRFGISEPIELEPNDFVQQKQMELNKVHEEVRRNIKLMSNLMKAKYDRRANCGGFEDGQLVWFYNPRRLKGRCPKLQTNWEGPYRIVKKLNDVVYRIQSCSSKRCKMKVVHFERLTPYFGTDK